MGSGTFKPEDWAGYSSKMSYDTKAPEEVINTRVVHDDLLPVNFKNGRRESRDSADNPASTAIVVAGDVTGSMGRLGGLLIKEGMAKFATEMYDRKPVTDPHIMGMAVGDTHCDRKPIQCTEFEADIRIVQSFERLYVEGGGGGNDSESYHVPWVVAALMTSIDCFEKRGEKGVIFTYGDECAPSPLTVREAKEHLGITLQADLTAEDALQMVSRTYDVYHLVIEQGNHCVSKSGRERVYATWRALLGQRVIPVADYTKLAEIMVSILQVRAGDNKKAVAASWKGGTDLIVANAISNLPVGVAPSTGIVTL